MFLRMRRLFGSPKRLLEARKSSKIHLRGLQNPSEKQLESTSASEDAFEPQFFRKFMIFKRFLDPPMEPKSNKKRLKFDAEKQYIFGDDFLLNFLRFGLSKWSQNRAFFVL